MFCNAGLSHRVTNDVIMWNPARCLSFFFPRGSPFFHYTCIPVTPFRLPAATRLLPHVWRQPSLSEAPPEERGLTSQGRRQNERQKPCWDLICSQISGEDEGRGNHMRALPNWSVLSAPESRFIPPLMMRQEVDWFRSHRAKNGSADRERGLVKYWVAPYDFGEGDSLQLACWLWRCEWVSECSQHVKKKKTTRNSKLGARGWWLLSFLSLIY